MVADRRVAVAEAIGRAGPGDTVLLAGKGHEQSIIVGEQSLPYDEVAAARAALLALGYA